MGTLDLKTVRLKSSATIHSTSHAILTVLLSGTFKDIYSSKDFVHNIITIRYLKVETKGICTEIKILVVLVHFTTIIDRHVLNLKTVTTISNIRSQLVNASMMAILR
jgi:hypothetical protein